MAERLQLWQVATTEAGAFSAAPPGDSELDWHPAKLPLCGSDADDHWFRHRVLGAGRAPTLRLDGLATVCDVYLDGLLVLRSESMFLAHELTLAEGSHELAICARALEPLLAQPRKPRARWRSRVPRENSLRWFRTTLLGRAPGFAAGPPVVGPWRPVWLLEASSPTFSLRPRLEGDDGILEVRAEPSTGAIEITVGGETESLPAGGGEIRLPRVERWWPHTHGAPHLYPVQIRTDAGELQRAVGFRDLMWPADLERDGLALQVNGVSVFARGAVWTPVADEELRGTLCRLRDAGLNVIRVAGTTVYESAAFHDLCDELGLLVWQDLMFANMDYPFAEPTFRALVEAEVGQALARVAGRPSLAVVCGNSEVEQQVGMLGLDPALGRGELFEAVIPSLMAEAGVDAAYLPSAPTGGEQPFRTDRGVANYFGVGAYLRPLDDARRAAVRFASECLAFANVPDVQPATITEGVMRDVGADWDFADVRDHYLELLHGIGRSDAEYWERARFVTGEVMAEVFGEWRRARSNCGGGIMLWSRDLVPGAGWGLLDDAGDPKVVWHFVRRALAPVAVWTTDEGLNGIAVHAANDGPDPVRARLRVALYRESEACVGEASEELELAAHTVVERSVEGLLGRFVDVSAAYRFGSVQQDLVVTTLAGAGVDARDFRFPAGRPRDRQAAAVLGLSATAAVNSSGEVEVTVEGARLLYGVRLAAAGYLPSDDAFSIEPGRAATVLLRATGTAGPPDQIELSALNLAGTVKVPLG
jgi:beta-mannosidase